MQLALRWNCLKIIKVSIIKLSLEELKTSIGISDETEIYSFDIIAREIDRNA